MLAGRKGRMSMHQNGINYSLRDIRPSDLESLTETHCQCLRFSLEQLETNMRQMRNGWPWREVNLERQVEHTMMNIGLLLADMVALSEMVGGFHNPVSFDFSERAARELETLNNFAMFAKRKADNYERYNARSAEDLR